MHSEKPTPPEAMESAQEQEKRIREKRGEYIGTIVDLLEEAKQSSRSESTKKISDSVKEAILDLDRTELTSFPAEFDPKKIDQAYQDWEPLAVALTAGIEASPDDIQRIAQILSFVTETDNLAETHEELTELAPFDIDKNKLQESLEAL